jgi:hypothetical protein
MFRVREFPHHYVSKKTAGVNMRSVLLATIADLANIGARPERREIARANFQKLKGFPGRNFRKFAGDRRMERRGNALRSQERVTCNLP